MLFINSISVDTFLPAYLAENMTPLLDVLNNIVTFMCRRQYTERIMNLTKSTLYTVLKRNDMYDQRE